MKKLLSILTITTLTTSIPAPLMAIVPATRDIGSTTKDVTNNYWTFIANIRNEDAIKNKDKYYIVIYKNKGESNWQIYKLQMGKPNDKPIFNKNIVESHKAFYRWDGVGEPQLPAINSNTGEITDWKGFDIKINEQYIKNNMVKIKPEDKLFSQIDNKYYIVIWRNNINNNWRIIKFNNNNILISIVNDNYPNLTKFRDRLQIGNSATDRILWKNDNGIYFKAVYRWDGVGEPQTPEIDSNGNITNWIVDKTKFQQGISFSLAENDKTSKWSNDGMRLTVDGELNIDINNKNIEEVYWDGSLQPQTSKKWNINVKPYIAKQNHKLVIKYDINGTKYTSEDINIDVLQTALSWLKTQSQFSLVDSTKTQTWTRSDLLSVDGELNIDIANPNIDTVLFDGVQQPQTNKNWKINVKPETAPHDHNLQVFFTLEGKQYKSEIIISMQAKINPVVPSIKQNLGNLIKTTDLGNIFDNNDDTIFSAVNQKNGNVIDDFSQIEITNKDNNKATLTAKPDSKSYIGSVDVTYNVVPTTIVDLKIDVIPTSSQATVVKDYLGQIDTSKMTNPVNTFYYTSSESTIKLLKPTSSSVITGIVYGCDEHWNKTSQSNTIDPINGIKLDGSQLATKDGKYIVELSDNLGHINNVYLQINEKKKDIKEYWNTDNGKQFEIWAQASGYDNIRGYSASQLNNLFKESKNWQQLASDSQFATAVAEWFKTNGKLSSTESLTKEKVVEQLRTQIPSDIIIPEVNTSNYDVNKVEFDLNESEFKPNDKGNITVKYGTATSEQFSLQIKNSSSTYNNKGGDSKLWIIGLVVGVLAGLGLVYLLFKRFVFDKYIYPKIIARRHDKLVEQIKKEETEKEAENNKGGDE
uniref:Arp1 n=1 Tax=Spiroplasma kunkelii CR2-3x TaxID=273035 RepID=Q5VCC1_SPIKU|nr:DUF3688 family protein [Spiroplasma kunkelii]AAS59566.1 Arp1 [Spiroplasma kunkelii CR2-3x]